MLQSKLFQIRQTLLEMSVIEITLIILPIGDTFQNYIY
jgi:hypothetical protein